MGTFSNREWVARNVDIAAAKKLICMWANRDEHVVEVTPGGMVIYSKPFHADVSYQMLNAIRPLREHRVTHTKSALDEWYIQAQHGVLTDTMIDQLLKAITVAEQTPKSVDKNNKYYYVYNPRFRDGPRYKHATSASALAEAERILRTDPNAVELEILCCTHVLTRGGIQTRELKTNPDDHSS